MCVSKFVVSKASTLADSSKRPTAAFASATCAVSNSASVTRCSIRWNACPVNLEPGKQDALGTLASRNSDRSRFGPGSHTRCKATANTISPTEGPFFAPWPAHARSMCPIRSSCSATQSSAPTSPTARVPTVRVSPRSAGRWRNHQPKRAEKPHSKFNAARRWTALLRGRRLRLPWRMASGSRQPRFGGSA